ncbi:MAG: T9SS type A sorting domain-containing protein [Flavobacteriaceae bacterium]
MKKIIGLLCFFTSITVWSQDFWTEFSTAQPYTPTGVKSISIVNNSTTWCNMACGNIGCTPIRRYAKTTNGGNSWTTQEIDLGPDSNQLRIANISGVSDLVAYAAVYPTTANVLGGIWQTTDGGNTWQKQTSSAFSTPIYSYPNFVHFWDANNGVAVGDPANGYFEIYTTADGGNNWSRVPMTNALVPLMDDEFGNENNFKIKGNSIWTFTTYGRILRSRDRGVSWEVFQSPLADFPCCFCDSNNKPDLAFTDENHGLIQSTDYQLFYTENGGETWGILNWSGALRDFNITDVPGLPNTYISIGLDIEANIERGSSYSIDAGNTWVSINNNPDLNYVDGGSIAMLHEDLGFAGGFSNSPTEGGIFRWGGGAMLRTAILANPAFAHKLSAQISPNPTSGLLNITGQNINKVEIRNLLGKIITTTMSSSGHECSVDLSNYAPGVYLVQVSSDQETSVYKVVKK